MKKILLLLLVFSLNIKSNTIIRYLDESKILYLNQNLGFAFKFDKNSAFKVLKQSNKSHSILRITQEKFTYLFKIKKNKKIIPNSRFINSFDTLHYNIEILKNKAIFQFNTNDNNIIEVEIKNKKNNYEFDKIFGNNLAINLKDFFKRRKFKFQKSVDFIETYFFEDYKTQLYVMQNYANYDENSMLSSIERHIKLKDGSFLKNEYNYSIRDYEVNKSHLSINYNQILDSIAKNNDIVMINEHHGYPHTRYNVLDVLKKLRNHGFKYFAMETIEPPSITNIQFYNDANMIKGYYFLEQTCFLVAAFAQSLGYELVAYEEGDNCSVNKSISNAGSCRDSIQAKYLAKVFEKDNDAKLFVLAGHSHIKKKEGFWKYTRVFLDEFLPEKKIFSIDQDNFVMTNNITKTIDINHPVFYDNTIKDEDVELHLISPHYDYYSQWYYENSEVMNKEIAFDMKIPFEVVEVKLKGINKQNNYNLFRVYKEVLVNMGKDKIYLPDTINFEIMYRDKLNRKI